MKNNQSMIGFSESKLDSYILNSGVDIVGYEYWNGSFKEAELHVKLKDHYPIIISQVFVLTLEAFL